MQFNPHKLTPCSDYIYMSNVRDITNFTTKCLQTDMVSYMEVTHQQLMIY